MPCLSGNYLHSTSPTLPVIVCPVLKNSNSSIKRTKTLGIIDTGATHTCISRRIVKGLDLTSRGQIKVSGVSGKAITDIFSVQIGLITSNNIYQMLPPIKVCSFIENEQKVFDLLIGMDIIRLGNLCLSFDGHFTFSF